MLYVVTTVLFIYVMWLKTSASLTSGNALLLSYCSETILGETNLNLLIKRKLFRRKKICNLFVQLGKM